LGRGALGERGERERERERTGLRTMKVACKPDAVVVLLGTNDIFRSSDEQREKAVLIFEMSVHM